MQKCIILTLCPKDPWLPGSPVIPALPCCPGFPGKPIAPSSPCSPLTQKLISNQQLKLLFFSLSAMCNTHSPHLDSFMSIFTRQSIHSRQPLKSLPAYNSPWASRTLWTLRSNSQQCFMSKFGLVLNINSWNQYKTKIAPHSLVVLWFQLHLLLLLYLSDPRA